MDLDGLLGKIMAASEKDRGLLKFLVHAPELMYRSMNGKEATVSGCVFLFKFMKISGGFAVYHENGKPMLQVAFKDGKPIGEIKAFNEDGSPVPEELLGRFFRAISTEEGDDEGAKESESDGSGDASGAAEE
jgi:hypothetical protein